MPDATFAAPDLTSFAGLEGLGLVALGQRIEPDRAVIACEPTGRIRCVTGVGRSVWSVTR